MTVCIGALCADAQGTPWRAAVVASDRMVTMGGLMEFEHEYPKVVEVTNRVLALVAGDALRGAQLVRTVRGLIPATPTTVEIIAAAAAAAYSEQRRAQVQAEFFTPRGIAMADFYNGLQQRLLPQIAGMLDQQAAGFDYGVEVLIAGMDDEGAHIHAIRNPGAGSNYASIGYTAIGSGALHALQAMIGFDHMGEQSLNDTVFQVYVAKRRAEVAPGVGQDTDVAVITAEGCMFLDQSVLEQLSRLYGEHQKPFSERFRAKISELKLT